MKELLTPERLILTVAGELLPAVLLTGTRSNPVGGSRRPSEDTWSAVTGQKVHFGDNEPVIRSEENVLHWVCLLHHVWTLSLQ